MAGTRAAMELGLRIHPISLSEIPHQFPDCRQMRSDIPRVVSRPVSLVEDEVMQVPVDRDVLFPPLPDMDVFPMALEIELGASYGAVYGFHLEPRAFSAQVVICVVEVHVDVALDKLHATLPAGAPVILFHVDILLSSLAKVHR